MTASNLTPEQQARVIIDAPLEASGCTVQNQEGANLAASQGVAVCEFRLNSGPADHLLFVDGRAVGVLEAKAVGHPLSGVEVQAERYAERPPDRNDCPRWPEYHARPTGSLNRIRNVVLPRAQELDFVGQSAEQ